MRNVNLPRNISNIRYYEPALDGLRFFAFLLVFLHHSLLNISSSNPISNFFLVIIQKNGWIGVDLFFILSGYLNTILLLRERQFYGKFSIKKFLLRRALRIWPLYFLAVFFGFFLVPFLSVYFFGNDYSDPKFANQINTQLPFYMSFMGNWAVALHGYGYFTMIAPLWTISLEQQFYFLWPFMLLLLTDLKKSLFIGSVIISAAVFTRFFLAISKIHHPGIYTNTFARMDILIIGAIFGLIVFYKPLFLSKVSVLTKTPFVLVSFPLLSFILYRIYLFDPTRIFSVVFGYLIIGLFLLYFCISALTNMRMSKLLSFRAFVFLGKISYGLYIWHKLALLVMDYTIKPDQIVLRTSLALFLTIVISIISYQVFEKIFLKYKTKFASVSSRPI